MRQAAAAVAQTTLQVSIVQPATQVTAAQPSPVQPKPVRLDSQSHPAEHLPSSDQLASVGALSQTVVVPFETAMPKPEPPPAPVINVQTPQPGAIFPQMADVIPVTIAKSGASATRPTKQQQGASNSSRETTKEPVVSISNSPTGAGGGRDNRKKWMIIAAVGAGVGIGAVLALNGHGGSSNTAPNPTGVTIGSPTISVGH